MFLLPKIERLIAQKEINKLSLRKSKLEETLMSRRFYPAQNKSESNDNLEIKLEDISIEGTNIQNMIDIFLINVKEFPYLLFVV